MTSGEKTPPAFKTTAKVVHIEHTTKFIGYFFQAMIRPRGTDNF